MIPVICNACGKHEEFTANVPCKLVCQKCGGIDLLLPKNVYLEDIQPQNRLYILRQKLIAEKSSPPKPPAPEKKDEKPKEKTTVPPIGDEGNKPPIPKEVKTPKPRRKKVSRS